MTPTIGRIVHYHSRGSADGRYAPEPRAAIITAVPEFLPEQPNTGPEGYVPAVHLAVLNPTGLFFDQNVPYSPEQEPGTWSWPSRV
ncbi:MAG TPA: hypothetical protein VIO38_15635 [Rariglobus sp.]